MVSAFCAIRRVDDSRLVPFGKLSLTLDTMAGKLKVGIIIGSTRPGRVCEQVANWVLENASKRQDAEFEIVDIAKFNLPVLDEPVPAFYAAYNNEHTKKWSEAIAKYDAYVFVTPEYNHGCPGALKNAIDYLYKEWNNKAATFVSYGSAGGVRAVEHLRDICGWLQVATVQNQLTFNLFTDFENFSVFKPTEEERKQESLTGCLDQVIAWGGALKPLRT
jgi:NAD(P)H-dependent FMN reductase